ncbi:MAG: YicC/YloC family endoribonuclease [Lentisphaeria bacterium]
MIHSMTGYGSGRASKGATSVAIEISAVNHKQRDFRFSLPPEVGFLEAQLKSELSTTIIRGSVTVTLSYELAPEYRAEKVEIDRDLAGHIIKEFAVLKSEHQLGGELSLADLAAVPGVIREREDVMPKEILTELALQALQIAVAQLDDIRSKEGEAIQEDLEHRVEILQKCVDAIETGRDETLESYREHLMERIKELGIDVDLNDERLLKEVAFVAQKADITEELVRLRSHLTQFRDFLASNEPGCGRQLQFVAQEMLREINTLGSKTRQTSVSREAITFKAELDRIREQVANVE